MNLVIVPFHDWRKIMMEGFRTRDSHFIEELNKKKGVVNIIINRPTTIMEILLKRKRNLIHGKVLLSKSGFKLYELETNLYLIDFISPNFLAQMIKGYSWFIEQYGNTKYLSFIEEALIYLGVSDSYNLLNQNIFAYKLSENLKPKVSVFDAWDNFLKFAVYNKILGKLKEGYRTYARINDFWITNSEDNIEDFGKEFNTKKISLIKNGVDLTRFVDNQDVSFPSDLEGIEKPIVGFGGKITQLIDYDLLNRTMRLTPSTSFVFVGQMLDKNIFEKIEKLENFYYLGDKHYDEYPNYVKNFDICIVPYVVAKDRKSGANSIKVYEYLATGKKVIGTNSNGLEDLSEHVFIIKTPEEFVQAIVNSSTHKKPLDIMYHSWKTKVDEFLKLVNEF